MPLREYPGFERKTRRVGRECQEVFVFSHDANTVLGFLPNDVAEHATLFVNVVLLRSLNFFDHINRQNWQRDQLRVGMLERCSSRFSMILENQDVLEAPIFLEIQDAVPEGP